MFQANYPPGNLKIDGWNGKTYLHVRTVSCRESFLVNFGVGLLGFCFITIAF